MNDLSPRPRSGFVTALGWFMIVGCALGLLITLLDAFVLLALGAAGLAAALPVASLAWGALLPMLWTVVLLMLGSCAVGLWIAIAFLARQSWARVAVIVLLAASALLNLVGTLWTVGLAWLGSGFMPMAGVPAVGGGLLFGVALAGLMALGVAVVIIHLWLIRRLMQPPVVAEFNA